MGPGAGLHWCGKSPPKGFDPRTFQPVASRYTDYAYLFSSTVKFTLKFTVKFTLKFTVKFTVKFTLKFTVKFTLKFTVKFALNLQ